MNAEQDAVERTKEADARLVALEAALAEQRAAHKDEIETSWQQLLAAKEQFAQVRVPANMNIVGYVQKNNKGTQGPTDLLWRARCH